jgi:hypothetical protein
VATGARGWNAALQGIAFQDANLVVIAHQALKLAQNHLSHKLRQMIVQRIPVYLESVVLATLALIDEGIVVILRQGRTEIHPSATIRAEDLAAYRRIAPELSDQSTQLRRSDRVAAGASHEELPKHVRARVFRATDEPTLTLSGNRQQLAERHNGVAVVHGSPLDIGTARFDSRRFTAFVIPEDGCDQGKSHSVERHYAPAEFFSRGVWGARTNYMSVSGN